MQQVKAPLTVIVFFFIILFLYTKVAGPIPFTINSITTAKSSLFMVSGTGKASAVPDTAFVSFGVTKTAPTVEAAQEQVNKVANKITSDLKALGVAEKDMQTTNYNVNPNYQYDSSGKQTTNGYTVSENIEVKIKPVEKANKAIDIATAAGANQVGGISFVLNDETKEKLQKQATEEAINKAKQQAQMLTAAAGIKLGRIADIQTGQSEPPIMYDKYAISANRAGGAPEVQTQLNPGENEVIITVTLGYETL
jgi:uncharacterized protein YggE